MEQARVPTWEKEMIEEAIRSAEERHHAEQERAHRRALQLAREQGYHRLAVAIDRPRPPRVSPNQLSLFPADPTLFSDES